MEIALIGNDSVRIKGKHSAFVVHPTNKVSGVNGVLYFTTDAVDASKIDPGIVIIKGPGEYELAGIKIAGFRFSGDTIYSLTVDSMEILVGNASSIEKDHAKLSNHKIVLLFVDTAIDAAFISALEPKTVLFFGSKAEETLQQLAKEGFRKESKYQVTIDKLPAEMETILLQ